MYMCDETWEDLVKFHSLRGKIPEDEQARFQRATAKAIAHVGTCRGCKWKVAAELCRGVFNLYPQKPDPDTPFFAMHRTLHRLIALSYVDTEHFGGSGIISV